MWEWESNGKTVADEFFSGISVLNNGYGGDWTQNQLWRAQNGELDNYEAKVITLLIGTNNHKAKKEDVAEGIRLILQEMRKRKPQAKIILHAIFPCNEKPDDPIRVKNDETNELIKNFADGENIIWFDIRKELMNEDGTISKEMFPDFLHPSPKGYRVWAEALKPYLEKYCKE
jgi:beta-glucosidase